MVSYPSMEKFDERYFTQSIRDDEQVEFRSVSAQWAIWMLNGPKSKEILSTMIL